MLIYWVEDGTTVGGDCRQIPGNRWSQTVEVPSTDLKPVEQISAYMGTATFLTDETVPYKIGLHLKSGKLDEVTIIQESFYKFQTSWEISSCGRIDCI